MYYESMGYERNNSNRITLLYIHQAVNQTRYKLLTPTHVFVHFHQLPDL